MNELDLTDEEFDGLRDEVLNRVLVGGDVFKNTTPTELEHFRFQVARHAPFDLVVDGLNVAYMSGTNVGPMVTANMVR